MENNYSVDWCEVVTLSSGKKKLKATLIGEDKVKIDDVTIWEDYPGFEGIAAGSTVSGTLAPAKDPKYGPSLYPPRAPKRASGGSFGAKMGEALFEKKEKSITKFQASKEESIRLVSAQRDATLIVTTFYGPRWATDTILEPQLDSLIKNKIVEMRDWFLSDDFNERPPFTS